VSVVRAGLLFGYCRNASIEVQQIFQTLITDSEGELINCSMHNLHSRVRTFMTYSLQSLHMVMYAAVKIKKNTSVHKNCLQRCKLYFLIAFGTLIAHRKISQAYLSLQLRYLGLKMPKTECGSQYLIHPTRKSAFYF